MKYEEFLEFHDKHPNLDNLEYYAEFPETNKSTIRSWKNRARQPITPILPPTKPAITPPLPTQQAAEGFVGYDEELVKLLCTQTNTPYNEFEGIDVKSAIMVLKAKLRNAQLQEPTKPNRAPNSPILPSPKPIGQNKKQFGIDPYIVFDDAKNEIRMEIPWDVLMNPEKNKALGEIK